MKQFKKIKEEFIEKCKDNGACQEEFKRILNSKNKKELITVIADNFNWCYFNKVVDSEFFDSIGEKIVNSSGIYYKGEIKVIESKEIIALCGDVVIGVLKNSRVNEMRGNSRVNEMRGSSRVNEMWESSRVNEMRENSRVNEMWRSSRVNEMWESSRVNEMWGSSRVNEMWGSSLIQSYNGLKPKFKGNDIVFIDYNAKKIICGFNFSMSKLKK